MRHFKNIGFRSSLQTIIGVIVFIFLIAFIIYYILDERKEIIQNISTLEKQKRHTQQILIQNEVNNVIAYIHYYRQLNQKQNDSLQQQSILNYLACIRFNWGGYVFVNTMDGQALVFDGKVLNDEKWITHMVDANGKNLFDPQKEAYYSPEGGFMEYFFKPLGIEVEPQPKLSYMKGYPDWKWIIGAGIYLPDINKEILAIKESYRKSMIHELSVTISCVLALGIFLLIFGNHFLKRIYVELESLRAFIHRLPSLGQPIDTESFKFREFKSLGESANKMLAELVRTDQQLRQSEERYRLLIEQAGDAIFTGDKDGIIIQVNSAGSKITGFPVEELLGKHLSELFTEEEMKKNPLQFDELNRGKIIIKEREIITKDHHFIPIEMNSRKIDRDLFISIIRDISERKKAEAELSKYKNHLEELVNERTHELKEKNLELERFNDLFIGREFRIKELKDRIKDLEKTLQTLRDEELPS